MPNNKTVITVIVSCLCGMAVLCVSTLCFLSLYHIEIPPALNTLASALVGALSAMLVKTSPSEITKSPDPTPPSNGNPIPVTVENSSAKPVPVEEKNEPA